MFRSLLFISFGVSASFGTLSAAIIGHTFTGKTYYNPATELADDFPVGTAWELRVEWDDTATGEVYGENQAGYPLTKLTLTLKGRSGDWTTSSLPGKPSFSLNRFGVHEIQFTSGWGPDAHTNGTIPGGQTYSVNLILSDPTNTALPDITTIPGPLDLSKWSPDQTKSQLKFYITETARAIYGDVNGLGVTTEPLAPEIGVQQPKGEELSDGKSTIRYGTVKKGKTGETKTFVIRNSGTDTLKGLRLAVSGKGKKDFTVSGLSKKSLAPGKSATFKVAFTPMAKGKRKASLMIGSNDSDESPFEIVMIGQGK